MDAQLRPHRPPLLFRVPRPRLRGEKLQVETLLHHEVEAGLFQHRQLNQIVRIRSVQIAISKRIERLTS